MIEFEIEKFFLSFAAPEGERRRSIDRHIYTIRSLETALPYSFKRERLSYFPFLFCIVFFFLFFYDLERALTLNIADKVFRPIKKGYHTLARNE